MSFNAEAKEVVDPIIDMAIRHDYKRRLCQIYTITGTYYCFTEENFKKGFNVLEEALDISEETNNIVAYYFASFWFGEALGLNCEFDRASKNFQKVLDIHLATNNLYGISALKSNIAIFCYFYSGRLNLGFETSMEAIRAAEESGDILSKVMAYTSHGMSCYGKGFLEEAEKHLLRGLEFYERINNPAWNAYAHFILGETYFELENFAKSKTHFENGIFGLDNTRSYPSWVALLKVGLDRSKVMNKEKDVILESLPVHFRNNKVKVNEGWIQRYIGEIFLNVDDGHFTEAEHWIHGAIEADRRNGMMLHLGRDHALCAELFKRKGDRSKFQEHLGKAMDIYKECGADGWLKKAEEEFAALS
jgi:tetratricopeptide (TPR) repeat protein